MHMGHIVIHLFYNLFSVFVLSMSFSDFESIVDFVMVYIGLPKYLFCRIFLCLPKL